MAINDKNTPTMLIILDGFGYNPSSKGNAIATANMTNWKKWLQIYPNKLINAAGKAVGLPEGFMGNSEVGHTAIGAGKIAETAFCKFHEAIKNGSFFKNEILIKNFEKLKETDEALTGLKAGVSREIRRSISAKTDNALHLIGLLSDAGVHSHQEHLYALIKLAKQVGLQKVYIHPFLDGRDTLPKSATKYLQELEDFCNKIGCGKIASLIGRFYAMDRDNNLDRTQIAYDALCQNDNQIQKNNWKQALKDSYTKDVTDEFFYPIQLIEDGIIKNGDGIVFFNFRPDRARQLTECFINPEFNHFPRQPLNSTNGTLSFFISTVPYKKEFENYNNETLFQAEKIEDTLLDEIAKQQTNKKVFVIAETEKYAHVTYFFRGLTEKKLSNETYTLIPSLKVKNYIDHPEMSAEKITDSILSSLKDNPAYFYLVNYANPDMVGHSGNFDATVKACEFLDKQLEKIYQQVVEKQNGTIFLTSDHGNAEEMIDKKTGEIKTSHTNNPVIFMMINKKLQHQPIETVYEKPTLGLANIAPTILNFFELKIPNNMEQKTIF